MVKPEETKNEYVSYLLLDKDMLRSLSTRKSYIEEVVPAAKPCRLAQLEGKDTIVILATSLAAEI